LFAEFATQYEIWKRVENFGLWVSAGVINRATRGVATVRVKTGTKVRDELLTHSDIKRIRDHLILEDAPDLEL